MSAIIAAVSDDGKVGHILTDSAIVADGIFVQHCSKAFTLPHARAAVAARGTVEMCINADLVVGRFSSVEEIEQFAPAALRDWYSKFYEHGPELEFVVVGWSKQQRCMRALFTRNNFPTPFEFRRGRLICLPDGYFDDEPLRADSLTHMLEAMQHHHETMRTPDGHLCVGGHAILTTIMRDVITQRVVREWPDQLGKRITP